MKVLLAMLLFVIAAYVLAGRLELYVGSVECEKSFIGVGVKVEGEPKWFGLCNVEEEEE